MLAKAAKRKSAVKMFRVDNYTMLMRRPFLVCAFCPGRPNPHIQAHRHGHQSGLLHVPPCTKSHPGRRNFMAPKLVHDGRADKLNVASRRRPAEHESGPVRHVIGVHQDGREYSCGSDTAPTQPRRGPGSSICRNRVCTLLYRLYCSFIGIVAPLALQLPSVFLPVLR